MYNTNLKQFEHSTSIRKGKQLTLNKSEFERYFFDKNYWNEYFDMLVENRFTTFLMIMGYNSGGYFSPPYPFLFNVPGFDPVRVEGLSTADQGKNRKA